MIEIEQKEDSAEKLAAIAGKPTKNFLFAEEVNQIVQEVNNLEATINPDRLISLGTETIDENEYTYDGYTWQLNGVQINNIGNPTIIVIPSATIGYKRNDISVFKADGTIERIAGTETNGEVVTTPDVPEGTLFYKSYSVNGIDIDVEPEPPAIDGSIYKKKIENIRWKSNQSGSDVVIPFQAAGQMHYSVVNSGLISVAGFSNAALTTPMYEGQDVLFENQTGNPITLKDMFSGISTPFNLGANLVAPNEGKIWFRFRNGELELIMKSWSDPLDLSAFDDVVEGYKSGANFYEDALHTILIIPETDKLYISISENKTYRWSGSAYAQLSSGIDFPSDGKTYGVKDGLAVQVKDFDLFNPYTSDYFIGTIRPSGTSFILSGFNNSWSVSGTLEAFFEISEYTLVGVKSATTSGASCQFAGVGNGIIRTYPTPRLNKLIHWQIFRNSDASFVADARFFVGIINKFAPIGNTNPSTNLNLVGVGADSGDTNIQVIHNDLSGVATKIDLGVNFPANTQNVDTYLTQTFFDIPNAKAYIRLVRLNTGHEVITEITTNLPAMSGGFDLVPVFWRNNGTTALEVKIRIGSYLQGQKMI